MPKQLALNAALSEVRELKELLPMCAGCQKIRNDAGHWLPADVYIRDHTRTRVSHGLCPDCMRESVDA